MFQKMKLFNFEENSRLRSVFLALSIVLGFVFIVLFTTFYVSDAIKNNNACGCVIPIPYMIMLLSSLGLFAGSFVFYILTSKHIEEKKELDKNIEFTLNFLDNDEKKIIKELIKDNGSLNQSEFEKRTKLNRVKVHRVIERLKAKGLVKKISKGNINKIELTDELMDIFIS